ncbi:hypothetical protein HK105_207845 [Polyrhizophydium stewartii]|uniref:Uncharacterized protein n=1 Tax=Polyrhizophydium stewartii TaxID=2732419 RepID=A0ABR4MZG7_9FUNG
MLWLAAAAAAAATDAAAAVASAGADGPGGVPQQPPGPAPDGSVRAVHFLIGSSVALLSACLSSLGVNLQASALRAQRDMNVLAESAGRNLLLIQDAAAHAHHQALASGTDADAAPAPDPPTPAAAACNVQASPMMPRPPLAAASPALQLPTPPPPPTPPLHPQSPSAAPGPPPAAAAGDLETLALDLPGPVPLAADAVDVPPAAPSAAADPQANTASADAAAADADAAAASRMASAAPAIRFSIGATASSTSNADDQDTDDDGDDDSDDDGNGANETTRLLPGPRAPGSAAPAAPPPSPGDLGIFAMLRLLLLSPTDGPASGSAPPARRPLSAAERAELWKRLYLSTQWYLGFALYLICQLFGSVIALGFISPVVLAPLGSAGLIFNVIFSSVFVGTSITRYDWAGTVLIVFGCAVVSTFGTNLPDTRKSIDDLIKLYSRPAFIAYFSVQIAFIICTFVLIKYLEFSLSSMRSLISRSSAASLTGLRRSASSLRAANLLAVSQPLPPQLRVASAIPPRSSVDEAWTEHSSHRAATATSGHDGPVRPGMPSPGGFSVSEPLLSLLPAPHNTGAPHQLASASHSQPQIRGPTGDAPTPMQPERANPLAQPADMCLSPESAIVPSGDHGLPPTARRSLQRTSTGTQLLPAHAADTAARESFVSVIHFVHDSSDYSHGAGSATLTAASATLAGQPADPVGAVAARRVRSSPGHWRTAQPGSARSSLAGMPGRGLSASTSITGVTGVAGPSGAGVLSLYTVHDDAGGMLRVPRDSVSARSITIRVKRGQLTALVGILYAVVGGITASGTLLLTKSGVELIVISIFDSDNQFRGAFAFVLLAILGLSIFAQLYSLNKALHYHLPVFVIPVFYTLFTCLSLANSIVYLDAFGFYSPLDLLFLTLGMGLIVAGVWVLGKSQQTSGEDETIEESLLE